MTESEKLSNGMATVRSHEGNKIAPCLSNGTLSPAVVLEWQTKAQAFFTKQKIPENEQVREILDCFKDQSVIGWIADNRETFVGPDYTFARFIKTFRELFLDPDWEDDIVRSVLTAKMSNSELFSVYADRVITGNNLLRGTDSCLDVVGLKKTLMRFMSESLALHLRSLPEAERLRLSNLEFQLWKTAIIRIDNVQQGHKRQMEEVAENLYRKRAKTEQNRTQYQQNHYQQNRPQYDNNRAQYEQHRPPTNEQYASGANNVSRGPRNRYPNQNEPPRYGPNRTSNSGGFNRRERRCPYLTDNERDTLAKHEGCFKCRMPYVRHATSNCLAGFPSADNYEMRTDSWCLARRPKPVASVHSGYNRAESLNHGAGPSTRAHISPAPETPPRVAVLPSVNFVLGNDDKYSPTPSPSTSEGKDDVSPFFVPHIHWEANYFSNGSDFPVAVDSLIDDACPYVLIRPDIVIELGLTMRKVKKPYHATSAFSSKECIFENYVMLQPSSLNNAWTSRPTRALIADDLCAPIILGLPFLQHNDIVIDYKERTVIDKKCDYRLVGENSVKRPKERKRTPHEIRKSFRNLRREWLIELKWKCTQRKQWLEKEGMFEKVTPFLPIAAVTARIEQLASTEKLKGLEEELKDEHKEIFEPIPHADLLPTEYTARIELKKAEKMILSRTYDCPRQFKDAFAKLIEQRLDSGFIRRSTSAYLSPSFIIPKADPKAMPRWVCDYRQLNANTIPDNYPLPKIDEILSDCAKGKIWGKIDMTDSFFQTRMHPDHVKYTVVTTPHGAFEWLVMPMGFRNAPAIHQRRVSGALQKYIGKICHIYLDDIIIWSQTIEEHIANVRTIMSALRDAKLYVNRKKTELFCYTVDFLGHTISQKGIEADGKKVERILNWPRPKSATDVRHSWDLCVI